MKRVRLTYEGALHHFMNRGILGTDIFPGNEDKDVFLKLVEEKSKKLKIKILAYIILDNHYHMVIQNTSGRMSDFAKNLNGEYGMYYRKKYGGKGYVFQGRYNSILIQNESYLIVAIAYVLGNPVSAGIVSAPEEYIWSSINEYFWGTASSIVDADFVNQLFGSRDEFSRQMVRYRGKNLPVHETKYGKILGEPGYLNEALAKSNRRESDDGDQNIQRRRKDDHYFAPIEKVMQKFESTYNVDIDSIDIGTYEGKRLRGELLVCLKDLGGLKYSEIVKLNIFSDIKLNSLSHMYKNAQRRNNFSSVP